MFGWFKRRLLARMGSLTRVAQMATFGAIVRDVGHQTRDAESIRGVKAAARTNFLFGNEPSEVHATQLDLPTEERAALEWLRTEPLYRELVVQTLRVVGTVRFGQGGNVNPVVGERVLSEFGAQFPVAPDPAAYDALVLRAVQALPEADQKGIAEWRRGSG